MIARALRMIVGILAVAGGVFVLESERADLEIARLDLAGTPVTRLALLGADGPAVVIAHGFAGSSQMMQGYGLPLARAGYRVYLFDFLGHGRHLAPMSGDVSSVDGTTRLLVDQTNAVIDAVAPGGAPVALLGHSMATDILVRVAAARSEVGPMVLLSAFSREIDGTAPPDLLLVTGAWEPGLRGFALEALRMVDPGAGEGDVAEADGVLRRAVVAPASEHVSILHARAGREAALDWIDRAYGRTSDVAVTPTGPAIVALLLGLVLVLREAARWLPARPTGPLALGRARLAAVLALPALAAPPLALLLEPETLPVLVADYLAVHLAIYGGIQLALLRFWKLPLGGFSVAAFAFLLASSAAIGLALDRYAANFLPTLPRLSIIALMSVGAVMFFLADARLSHGASLGRRVLVHATFLLSLGLAVALDFEGLFFLLMIAPVIVLFYLVFGTLGHAASNRAGPLAAGVALGLVLAWALGVSFPLFAA